MELKDIMTITYELLRVKEDRMMMRYEDDLSACRRSHDNLLKKYKRSTSLLVSLQSDYDVLKNKVYVKKRPIDSSFHHDHVTAKKIDDYDGMQSNNNNCVDKQQNNTDKIINHNSSTTSSDINVGVMKKSKTIDTVVATATVNPIAAAFTKSNHNDKSVMRSSSSSNACPIVVWVDSQSSVSSYEENKEHHHQLIVKLLEKDALEKSDDRGHIKSVSNDYRSNVAKNNNGGVDVIDKDYIAPKKPPINAYQRSVSMTSSHLDVSGRYGGNHLNDLIGPQRRNPPQPQPHDDDDDDDSNNNNINMHREDKEEEEENRIQDRRNVAMTGRWNDKDDAFDCDADIVNNNNNKKQQQPVRKVQRKEDKRIDGKGDDGGRNKDQFQRLLDLRTMKTTSTNHINKLNKEEKDVTMKCIETVRGKENRAALPGHTCMECLKFYETMQQQGVYSNFSDSQVRRKVLQSCSRHKAKWSQPSTPEGFWDLSLGTPEDWK